ncbi:molybdopterin-dependent oxidoreductase, partial [Micrococcus luteus]|nr:molybdopterin-dependent oxidoreductase [Micrococcus luteus]
SKTQNYLECEQLYVNPMTDVALMLAIAHTLYTEELYDRQFIDDYAMGFDDFTPYLMGKTIDMVEKTPEWAEAICGVPAERIRELARLMAGSRTQ